MRSSQVTKPLVSNKKNFEAMAHEILDMVTGDLFEEIANRVMAENDGNEDSVMESLGADGKFACSRDATTYEGVTGEAVAFKVAPAATPTQLQQLDAFVGSTDMVGDMAMDAADFTRWVGLTRRATLPLSLVQRLFRWVSSRWMVARRLW